MTEGKIFIWVSIAALAVYTVHLIYLVKHDANVKEGS